MELENVLHFYLIRKGSMIASSELNWDFQSFFYYFFCPLFFPLGSCGFIFENLMN